MTFRLDLANRASLFKNYASWHEDNNTLDKSHITFTFSICYLINSIENINKYKNECLLEFKLFEPELRSKSDEICFQSPSLFNIFTEISVSLTQLRIIQNTLLEIVGKKLQISMLSSMNDYVKKIKNRPKSEAESIIYQLIANYWNNNGLKVKQYRDLDQHYGQLFHNAIINKNSAPAYIELRLPDNPEAKNWNKFTYCKKIDAIAFIQESFTHLHELVNDICKTLDYKNEREFDLNVDLSNNYQSYLTVTFDPYQKMLHGQEIMKENGEVYGANHIKEFDLDKLSFVKIPDYFNGKPMTKKYFSVGEKIKLEPHDVA